MRIPSDEYSNAAKNGTIDPEPERPHTIYVTSCLQPRTMPQRSDRAASGSREGGRTTPHRAKIGPVIRVLPRLPTNSIHACILIRLIVRPRLLRRIWPTVPLFSDLFLYLVGVGSSATASRSKQGLLRTSPKSRFLISMLQRIVWLELSTCRAALFLRPMSIQRSSKSNRMLYSIRYRQTLSRKTTNCSKR